MSAHWHKDIEAACELAQTPPGALATLKPGSGAWLRLHKNHQIGTRAGGRLRFDEVDRTIIRHWLERQAIDPWEGVPEGVGRTEIARYQLSEKRGALSVQQSRRLMAVAPLGGDPGVVLGGTRLSLPRGAFLTLTADPMLDLAADYLLTIENKDVFVALCEAGDAVARPGCGLMVYRGDPSAPFGDAWAQALVHRMNLPRWHAPDMDPAGLSHSLDPTIIGVWVPVLDSLSEVVGNKEDFDRQAHALPGVMTRAEAEFPALLPWAEWLMANRVGVTQERAIAHVLPFTWVTRVKMAEWPGTCAPQFIGPRNGT